MSLRFSRSPSLRIALLSLLPLAAWSSASFAQSDSPSPALDRASFRIGGYYANVDTDIGASDNGGLATGTFNLEDDLGFKDHETVPRARADFLIGDHQGLALDYYSIDRSRTASLVRDISYGGVDYAANANVRAKLDFDFGSVAWRWWFGQGNDAFGVGLGGAWYQIDTRLSGPGAITGLPDGTMTASVDTGSKDSAWAPMLQLGWRHSFNDQWRMYIDASGVKKNGGRLSGHIYNAALGVEWLPWEHVGFGAEYNFSRIKLDWRRTDYTARLDMKLNGPSMYVNFRF
ncbi:hypothetical protein ACO2Q2_10590 [Dyella sp. KRB-257]|uniref:hypothetical protein n=1 Tax=Dyella sp. KRB-257 TaxID=3400915 RepID=UPI003C0C0DDF